jgi:hypothetical protein
VLGRRHNNNPRFRDNLQRRLPAPARNRGRLQRQIRRAFYGQGPELTSTAIYDVCYSGHRSQRRVINQGERHSVWRLLRLVTDPIRKVPPHNAWLWRLKPEMEAPSPLGHPEEWWARAKRLNGVESDVGYLGVSEKE